MSTLPKIRCISVEEPAHSKFNPDTMIEFASNVFNTTTEYIYYKCLEMFPGIDMDWNQCRFSNIVHGRDQIMSQRRVKIIRISPNINFENNTLTIYYSDLPSNYNNELSITRIQGPYVVSRYDVCDTMEKLDWGTREYFLCHCNYTNQEEVREDINSISIDSNNAFQLEQIICKFINNPEIDEVGVYVTRNKIVRRIDIYVFMN